MKIRKFTPSDTLEIGSLVAKVFCQYNSGDGDAEAVQAYIDRYNPSQKSEQELLHSFLKSPIFLVAEDSGKILGIMRGSKTKITNLYVDGAVHGKGVGKALLQKFENIAVAQGSTEIKMRASSFAVPFYQYMGYKKTTGARKLFGLTVWPMRKKFDKNT